MTNKDRDRDGAIERSNNGRTKTTRRNGRNKEMKGLPEKLTHEASDNNGDGDDNEARE